MKVNPTALVNPDLLGRKIAAAQERASHFDDFTGRTLVSFNKLARDVVTLVVEELSNEGYDIEVEPCPGT